MFIQNFPIYPTKITNPLSAHSTHHSNLPPCSTHSMTNSFTPTTILPAIHEPPRVSPIENGGGKMGAKRGPINPLCQRNVRIGDDSYRLSSSQPPARLTLPLLAVGCCRRFGKGTTVKMWEETKKVAGPTPRPMTTQTLQRGGILWRRTFRNVTDTKNVVFFAAQTFVLTI